ncbi:hypothetical protein [Streptomyces sp. 1331.2]|uniref:hypothetical protein n=1 Tax=Streptomyces sp. 1331.2 TaxID=1938835 RepID=UPI000BD42396|nr:hypothetical protein [Streptomyces sp. 1331.2]SOB78787.1 hypothetical protein SAMN06272789_0086 [Streptomyces sp. 1331.2]SOB86354.1 hypothetical protein SAMN06272789_6666 [Streptomyces sp. 1331.2]
MRTPARLAALAAVTAIGLGTIATGTAQAAAPAPATVQAARSTTVHLTNGSGCTLQRTDYSLAHGIWSPGMEPSPTVGNGWGAVFASESNGFLTGTEGTVTYRAYDCEEGWRNGRTVVLHWANPYAGSNSYDEAGTDLGAFRTTREGGTGNNADVSWGVWKS